MTRDEVALQIIARVIVREGGVGDAHDGKGITRWGQTPKWLADFGFEVPNSPEDAARNYQTWLVRTRLIGICDYPDTLADAVIDFAVNSGHPAAIRALQSAIGLKPDGIWGPETQAAVDGCDRRRVAGLVNGDRLRLMGRLVTRNPQQYASDCEGWLNRMAGLVEALA